jgi:integrase
MRLQQGWLTFDGPSRIGHFRTTKIDENGKETRVPVARRVGPREMDDKTAYEELRRLIVEETGITSDGSITLEGFIKSRWIPMREGDWRESSRETVTQKLGTIYERFKDAPLNSIDSVALQTWINQLAKTRSASTVKMARAYLKSIFAEATEQDYLRKNPARLLRVPKQLKPVSRPFLSMEEIEALLKAAAPFGVKGREYALLRLLLVTGLRPSEVLALRWYHVNLTTDNSTIRIASTIYRGKIRPYSKTSKEGEVQTLVLPPLAAQVLTEWSSICAGDGELNQDAFVFPDSEGGFLHVGNYLHRTLQPLARQAGIKTPLTFQMLRRTVGTWAASFGDLKSTQAILRHKHMQTTTDVYTQIIESSHKATAGKLDEKMAGSKKG